MPPTLHLNPKLKVPRSIAITARTAQSGESQPSTGLASEGESRHDVLLHTDSLRLEFGGVRALNDLGIDVIDDELLAIVGPNGSGKTSFLNSINGFYRPKLGQIVLDGRDILGERPHRIAQLGVARTFQHMHLYGGLSVLDNLMAGRHKEMDGGLLRALVRPWGIATDATHREVVERVIRLLELQPHRHANVASLGYGIRKRVDLGRALCMEPRILLLDEPMAGMNVEEKEDISRFILEIRQERHIPIVLVEHDLNVVTDLADRIAVLDWGNLVAVGPPHEVLQNPDVIKAYLGEPK